MQREAFERELAQEGFAEGVTVTREAGDLEAHTHPFEAKALILSGEIAIRVGDSERVYREGDVFHLKANEVHAERYGPAGVQYLVGRKTLH
ncbi:cupin domain-containing protein [Pandoraea bronchicola]|uniref:Cupin n=1 Tax=Pandoraea bronchicola TaxID=2508287 RepID=A0A5E5BTA2_9BURK|nr:cupin domain-containing protein [Pandoraea bronchicola]VVE89541.1 cupin [Pandoraea bronchicola]